jgi:glycosyltransferase involved in cell wall biosynthesis
MKRILFLGQFPPPYHGVSVMNSYILNSELITGNYQLEIVDLKFSTSIKELRKISPGKIYKMLYYGFQIVKKVLTKKPDIVYFIIVPTGLPFYRDAFYVMLLKLFRSKIVFHLHGKGIRNEAGNNSLKKRIYKWVFKNTTVICLSEHLTRDISEVYDSKPFIIPNGIKVQPVFNRIANRSDGSPPQILYLSHYLRNKGILVLIDALAILHNRGFLFTARLAGEPADLTIEFLEQQVHEKNLSELVKIIGPQYDENKSLEFQNADIFVLPTYNDVFGLVNLEAMQYKLPVVSTYEGSIPDVVIDNVTGLLVETKNPQALADKLAILLNDKNMRKEMGMKGFERFMNNYTLDKFFENLNSTFQTLLNI